MYVLYMILLEFLFLPLRNKADTDNIEKLILRDEKHILGKRGKSGERTETQGKSCLLVN